MTEPEQIPPEGGSPDIGTGEGVEPTVEIDERSLGAMAMLPEALRPEAAQVVGAQVVRQEVYRSLPRQWGIGVLRVLMRLREKSRQSGEPQPQILSQAEAADRRHKADLFALQVEQGGHLELYWQELFENDPWMLEAALPGVRILAGRTYLGGKTHSGQQGQEGAAADFIAYKEVDDGIVIIEIKCPDGRAGKLVGGRIRGRQDSMKAAFSNGSGLSEGVPHILNEMDIVRNEFNPDSFTPVMPNVGNPRLRVDRAKAVLIIGRKSDYSAPQLRSFEMCRAATRVEIITYDEIVTHLEELYGSGRTEVGSQ